MSGEAEKINVSHVDLFFGLVTHSFIMSARCFSLTQGFSYLGGVRPQACTLNLFSRSCFMLRYRLPGSSEGKIKKQLPLQQSPTEE
jgi:hypothetical protein